MRVLALAAITFLATACGSGAGGAKLFRAECAGCHTLTGHEHGAMGGDLGIPKLAVPDIVSFARQMPTPHRLSAKQANEIAVYVHAKETGR